MTISFKDKVVIVTGSGNGLGRSHALQFAQRGAKIVVNDLGGTVDGSGGSSEAAEKVVEEIKKNGGEAIANGSSVTDKAGVKKLVDDAMAAFGRIDVLVNNAGVLRDKSFAKVTLEDFEFVVDVDFKFEFEFDNEFGFEFDFDLNNHYLIESTGELIETERAYTDTNYEWTINFIHLSIPNIIFTIFNVIFFIYFTFM